MALLWSSALFTGVGQSQQQPFEVRKAESASVQTIQQRPALSVQTPLDDQLIGEGIEVFDDTPPAVALAEQAVEQVQLRSPAKRIQISLEAGVVYDDNVFLNAREQVADVLYRVSPAIRLAWGEAGSQQDSHLLINYRPEAILFQQNSGENAIDHDASVKSQKTFARLTAGGGARFQRLSGSTVDLGDRADRSVYNADLNLTYGWGVRTTYQTTLLWESTRYDDARYSDYDEWVHENFLGYSLSGKSRLAAGFAWGQLDVSGQSRRQRFQRALLRFETDATGKLALQARGGVEFRQTGAGDTATPVFGVGAEYRWREGTVLTAQVSRSVEASAMDGQNFVRTGASGGVRQRLSKRFIFSLDAGWENYRYQPADVEADGSDREDDDFFVRSALKYVLRDNLHAEAWYQWRTNRSSLEDQTYDVNQTGLNFRIDF